MNRTVTVTLAAAALILANAAFAAPRDDLLGRYAAAAKSGLSAARGQTFHNQAFTGGKPDTPSCTSCHGKDPRAAGRTLTGKNIAAMAVSVTPARYGDPAKVEKWFKRNCNEVLGRECTAQEKGDWLAYMTGQ